MLHQFWFCNTNDSVCYICKPFLHYNFCDREQSLLSPWWSKLLSEHGLSAEVCVTVLSDDSRLLIKDSERSHEGGSTQQINCSLTTTICKTPVCSTCLAYLFLIKLATSRLFRGLTLLSNSHALQNTIWGWCATVLPTAQPTFPASVFLQTSLSKQIFGSRSVKN